MQRDLGLYCHDIESRVADGALVVVVRGKHDAMDHRHAGLGEIRALTEWFKHWASDKQVAEKLLNWNEMRTNLQVPFVEKDEAKQLGARWDAARKVWYIENKADMSPFARWMPTLAVTSGTGEAPPKSPPVKKQTTGIAIVGSCFVEQPRICNCLPWDVCDKCRCTALNN